MGTHDLSLEHQLSSNLLLFLRAIVMNTASIAQVSLSSRVNVAKPVRFNTARAQCVKRACTVSAELNEEGSFPSVKFPDARLLKNTEIRALSTSEIEREVAVLRRHLIEFQLMKPSREKARQQSGVDETDTSLPGKYRKQIARLLTIRREREIEEGISKRESKKMHKFTKGAFTGIPEAA